LDRHLKQLEDEITQRDRSIEDLRSEILKLHGEGDTRQNHINQVERSRADVLRSLENMTIDFKAKSDADAVKQIQIIKKEEEITALKVQIEGLYS
jgi:chromosome segregation ATPase